MNDELDFNERLAITYFELAASSRRVLDLELYSGPTKLQKLSQAVHFALDHDIDPIYIADLILTNIRRHSIDVDELNQRAADERNIGYFFAPENYEGLVLYNLNDHDAATYIFNDEDSMGFELQQYEAEAKALRTLLEIYLKATMGGDEYDDYQVEIWHADIAGENSKFMWDMNDVRVSLVAEGYDFDQLRNSKAAPPIEVINGNAVAVLIETPDYSDVATKTTHGIYG